MNRIILACSLFFPAAVHAAAPHPALRYDLAPSSITAMCSESLARAERRYDALVALDASSRTFENTPREFSSAYYDMFDELGSATFLKDVSTDSAVRQAGTDCATRLDEFDVKLYGREDLFKALSAYAALKVPLKDDDQRLVDKELLDYKRNGFGLPPETRAKLAPLQTQLVQVKNVYEKNLAEVKDFLAVSTPELAGLPQDFIDGLQTLPDGKRKVTLDYPDYIPFMRNARDGDARRRLEFLFNNRASTSNVKLLEQAIDLRRQIAGLLGYPTHAAYVLEPKMAKDPKTVKDFLDRLRAKIRPLAESELETMRQMKAAETGDVNAKIMAWDFSYYDNALKKAKYSVDDELVKEYFPLDTVLSGMLKIYQKLFGVRFEEQVNPGAWHPDVKLYKTVDADTGAELGWFYMDLFPRDGKYKHAAAFTLIQGRELPGGKYQKPVSSIVANMSKPTPTAPSLLKHSEVETLFHEFGHIMHITLMRARHGYNRSSEFTVAQDFVEAPSQMLENWVWDKDMLKAVSGHYKDKAKKLPGDLLKRMLEARNLNNGLVYSRQVFFGSVDMEYHASTGPVDTTAVWDALKEPITLIPPSPGTHPAASFGHLMGGYDAGYYGYAWSEVYADDMFSRFEKEGLLNGDTGRQYRTLILEPGRSKDEAAQLRAFLGREPNEDAFLRIIGFSSK